MIDVEDLIALVRNYNPQTNADLIRRAYAYGKRMHEGQFRKSGEPYFTHPVAVAAILTEQRLDDATIVTALLHDTIEDTKASYTDVAREFVAAARKPIRFIATWLLICSAANGLVGERRLRAIANAARADIQRIAHELEIDKKLAAIDRRIEAAWQAQRRAAGHTPESVAAWIEEAFAPLDSAQ